MSDEEEYSEEEEEEEEDEAPAAEAPSGESEEDKKKREEEEKKKAADESAKKRAEQAKKSADEAKHAKEEEERLKKEELERKKAEIRAKLEAQSSSQKSSGFLTGARKKKLKAFLRKKIREDMEAKRREEEEARQRILNERIRPVTIEGKNEGQLRQLIQEIYERICKLEEEKYDLQMTIDGSDKQINDLTIEVNNLRGKFVKPILKKISKYDNKFKTASKAMDCAEWRANLKPTGSSKFNVSGEDDMKKEKPEWGLGAKEQKAAEGEA